MWWYWKIYWPNSLASYLQTVLVQFNHHLVVRPYLKFPFELSSSTSAFVQKTTHQLGTTHQMQRGVVPTWFYQGFPGGWQFFLEGCRASHRGTKHSLSPTLCLNYMVILKYLTNAELYLTFSKYADILLVVKSLINIVKFAYFNVVFYSFFLADIYSLINNLKTFNGYVLILVGTFIDALVWVKKM